MSSIFPLEEGARQSSSEIIKVIKKALEGFHLKIKVTATFCKFLYHVVRFFAARCIKIDLFLYAFIANLDKKSATRGILLKPFN